MVKHLSTCQHSGSLRGHIADGYTTGDARAPAESSPGGTLTTIALKAIFRLCATHIHDLYAGIAQLLFQSHEGLSFATPCFTKRFQPNPYPSPPLSPLPSSRRTGSCKSSPSTCIDSRSESIKRFSDVLLAIPLILARCGADRRGGLGRRERDLSGGPDGDFSGHRPGTAKSASEGGRLASLRDTRAEGRGGGGVGGRGGEGRGVRRSGWG